MSEIDLYKTMKIGEVAGVSLYVPQQDIPSLKATKSSVIVGGGNGEHSIFVTSQKEILIDAVSFFIKDSKVYALSEDFLEKHIDAEPVDFKFDNGDEWYELICKAISEGYSRSNHLAISRWLSYRIGLVLLENGIITNEFDADDKAFLQNFSKRILE